MTADFKKDFRAVLIRPEQAWPIRQMVLRPMQTLSDCEYPLDNESQSIHFGAIAGEELIAVASFYSEESELFDESIQYRIRGMATLVDSKGQGAGTALLDAGLNEIKTRHENSLNDVLVWCNSRTTASGFYARRGFNQVGDTFDLPPIGEHVVLCWRPTPA